MISNKIEFGDFQTPNSLAMQVCQKLHEMNIRPDYIIEPTCGLGSFVLAGNTIFNNAKTLGFDINHDYIAELRKKTSTNDAIFLDVQDFFSNDWHKVIANLSGSILVLGNPPWVTNSVQGVLDSCNLPEKSNFLKLKGLDAVTGKSNFDISEWMLIEILSWFKKKTGVIAMLVKTSVARKVIQFAEKNKIPASRISLMKINARFHFNASVDACIFIMHLNDGAKSSYDYSVYDDVNSADYNLVGHRDGFAVSNLRDYEKFRHVAGKNGIKWRSGIKHDLSAVMELTSDQGEIRNGFGETVEIEHDLLFPLMKGSDIGSNKEWRGKYVLITQSHVGQSTEYIKIKYPATFKYLEKHSEKFAMRKSIIYKNTPRFSIFGVGDYSFKPWKIAICGLYKKLNFKIIAPINNKSVMFDDTVYFISFDTEKEAVIALAYLQSNYVKSYLNSVIFWDEKRPIKTSLLNSLAWETESSQFSLI